MRCLTNLQVPAMYSPQPIQSESKGKHKQTNSGGGGREEKERRGCPSDTGRKKFQPKMGNYRFRLSDMIPNAWFYKLKDMSKGRKLNSSPPFKKKPPSSTATSQKSNFSQPRHSYYFTTEGSRADKQLCSSPIYSKASDIRFPDPPRISSRRRSRRKTIYKPSPKLVSTSFPAYFSCHAQHNSAWTKSIPAHSPGYSSSPLESSPEPADCRGYRLSESDEDEDDEFLVPSTFDDHATSWSSSCNCKLSSSTADIIIDMNEGESIRRRINKVEGFDTISQPELAPILTKPAKAEDEVTEVSTFKRSSSKLEGIKSHKPFSVKVVKEENIRTHNEQKTSPLIRKSPSNSTGIRLRSNSPRIASKKIQAHARKSVSSFSRNGTLSESLAVVKSSVDPQRDFRDSMVEMIVENNIKASKDLEDLLACYLSLNSNEYHDVIVKAFEQVWLKMTELHL